MGRGKAFIPIILALVVATGGSAFLYRWLQAKNAPAAEVKVEAQAVPVVVAAADLNWGTKLSEEMLKTVPFLKESLPRGFVSDPKLLEGRVLIAALKQQDPVLESRLAPKDVTVGGVSAVIKKGMRAVAVKGDKVIGISGFIQPGNRVDVLVTMKDPATKQEITKMVLSNVLVLATGTEIEEKNDGKPQPVDVYTLEVDPEQGERLSLAATRGKLQFALRNVTDQETVLTKGATVAQTLRSLRGVDPTPPLEHCSWRCSSCRRCPYYGRKSLFQLQHRRWESSLLWRANPLFSRALKGSSVFPSQTRRLPISC
ncbi:MAG: Flp pilus assembly protein CpaB [Deltaproteobacteria bacterium]